ncbi:MAG TPA: hypothetical protein VGU45_04215 [Microvirga sp.]|nr:hypothetical protein [Microvirga sp.]
MADEPSDGRQAAAAMQTALTLEAGEIAVILTPVGENGFRTDLVLSQPLQDLVEAGDEATPTPVLLEFASALIARMEEDPAFVEECLVWYERQAASSTVEDAPE